jgi:hypothetical protein
MSLAMCVSRSNALADIPALSNSQGSIFEGGEFSERVARVEFELLGGFLVDALGEFERVVEVEFFEEPGCADGARGLEEVEGDWGHGGLGVY